MSRFVTPNCNLMRPSIFLLHKLTLSSREFGAMHFNHATSPGNPHHRISRSNNAFGSLIASEVTTDDFDLCYGRLSVMHDTTLSLTAKRSFLGLLFNLGDDIEISVQGFRSGIRRRGQYGLVYLPSVDIKSVVQKDRKYLFLLAGIRNEKHIEYFKEVSVIADLLQNIRNKTAGHAGASSGIVTQQVKEVTEVLAPESESRKFYDAVEVHFLNTKMHELLNHVVKLRKWEAPASRTAEIESQALERIHNHLLAHLDSNPGTLRNMAKIAGMSSNRMNQHFKEKYGATIFEYLKRKRMEKTVVLLMQGMPLQEIASAVGYSSVSHFTAAFKKEHGMPPGKMRAILRK